MLLISSFIGFFFFLNLSFKWFPIELHSILLAWRLLGYPPYNCSCTRLGTHQKRHPSLLAAGINTAEVPSRLRSNAGREFRIQGDTHAPTTGMSRAGAGGGAWAPSLWIRSGAARIWNTTECEYERGQRAKIYLRVLKGSVSQSECGAAMRRDALKTIFGPNLGRLRSQATGRGEVTWGGDSI